MQIIKEKLEIEDTKLKVCGLHLSLLTLNFWNVIIALILGGIL